MYIYSYIYKHTGVIPSPSSLILLGGQKVSPLVTVFNRLAAGPVDITPVGKLDNWTTVIKPSVAGKYICVYIHIYMYVYKLYRTYVHNVHMLCFRH
jgi:hypothetical protein